MGEVTTEELATLQREFDWLLSQEVSRLFEKTDHCCCWLSLIRDPSLMVALNTALSHVTTRFLLCWHSWGKRSPSARPSSLCRYFQSKFVLHHSVYWFFWSCSILSEATSIGRTSKCWTTKLLRQVCSHHNRPDEGSNQQFSGECSFETSIVLRRVVAKY